MPTLQDLMSELRDVGIAITDEATLSECADANDAWPAAVLRLVREGRKRNVRFTRSNERSPTDDELCALLRGYGFTEIQSQQFIANLVIK